MTDTEQSSIPVSAGAEKPRTCPHKKKVCFGIGLVLVFLLATGWYFFPRSLMMRDTGTAQNSALMDQRLAAVEQQVTALNSRLDEINAHLSATSTASDPTAVSRMQSDVAALSTAMNGIEAEVKRTGAAAMQRQQVEQSSMAAAIAFIQLRSAAEAGRGFAAELAAVKGAAPDDARFREVLVRLEPYTAKGAPKPDSLREEFIGLEPSISIAVSRSTAQGWWERLSSEMKGLISIRPLHGGGAMDSCTAVEDALSSGDLNAALAAISHLPPGAQDVLKSWRTKAEARIAVDAGLHDLSDRLTALAAVAAPATQGEP